MLLCLCVLCAKTNNINHSEVLEEKNACIATSDTLLQQKEEQLNQMRSDLAKWVVYAFTWPVGQNCGTSVVRSWPVGLCACVCVCVRSRAQEELAVTQKACRDLSENLRKTANEKENSDLKSSAEIDDLYRTKRNLEERLIELIRYSCPPPFKKICIFY